MNSDGSFTEVTIKQDKLVAIKPRGSVGVEWILPVGDLKGLESLDTKKKVNQKDEDGMDETREEGSECSSFEKNRMKFESRPLQKPQSIPRRASQSKIPQTVKKWTPPSSSSSRVPLERVLTEMNSSSPTGGPPPSAAAAAPATEGAADEDGAAVNISKSTILDGRSMHTIPLPDMEGEGEGVASPTAVQQETSRIPRMPNSTLNAALISPDKQEREIIERTPFIENTDISPKRLYPALTGVDIPPHPVVVLPPKESNILILEVEGLGPPHIREEEEEVSSRSDPACDSDSHDSGDKELRNVHCLATVEADGEKGGISILSVIQRQGPHDDRDKCDESDNEDDDVDSPFWQDTIPSNIVSENDGKNMTTR